MSQTTATAEPISPLRRRMIENMTGRGCRPGSCDCCGNGGVWASRQRGCSRGATRCCRSRRASSIGSFATRRVGRHETKLRTDAAQQNDLKSLRPFDYLVNLAEMHRYVEAQRLGDIEVDDKLVPRRGSHRHVGCLLALEDSRHNRRRICSPCCARAESGHAKVPPTSPMNSRRFIR
jgi:hypothetical protein